MVPDIINTGIRPRDRHTQEIKERLFKSKTHTSHPPLHPYSHPSLSTSQHSNPSLLRARARARARHAGCMRTPQRPDSRPTYLSAGQMAGCPPAGHGCVRGSHRCLGSAHRGSGTARRTRAGLSASRWGVRARPAAAGSCLRAGHRGGC